MGMMHHHQNHGSMGLVGLIVAMIGLILFAALVYEIMMNRTWIMRAYSARGQAGDARARNKALE